MAAPTKKWDPMWDDRNRIAEAAGVSKEVLDQVLDGLFKVICDNPRTRVVGKAMFYWGTCNRTLPGGDTVASRRLCVRLSRALATPMKAAAIPGAVDLTSLGEL